MDIPSSPVDIQNPLANLRTQAQTNYDIYEYIMYICHQLVEVFVPATGVLLEKGVSVIW